MTRLSSTAVKALIQAGALDYFGMSRTKMMFEYGLINDLTAKEQEHALNHCLNFETLKDIIYCVIEKPRMSSKRKDKLLGL